MARTKKSEVLEEVKTSPNVEEKPTPTRSRKKKVEELAEISALMREKTQEELEYEEFNVPINHGLMIHTSSDYEMGKDAFKLCDRHLKYLMRSTENNALKIGVLLNTIQQFHNYQVSDKYNYSYDTRQNEFNLHNVVANNARRKWFKDIYDYAAYELGISKGTASNYMNIARRFSTNKINCTTGKVDLLPEYENYTVSQLVQLLPYDDYTIELALECGRIDYNMSCRFLRQQMKEYTKKLATIEDKQKKETSVDDVIEGQLLLNSDGTITQNEIDMTQAELYAECSDFESACNEDVKSSIKAFDEEMKRTHAGNDNKLDDVEYQTIATIDKLPDNREVFGGFTDMLKYWIDRGYTVNVTVTK